MILLICKTCNQWVAVGDVHWCYRDAFGRRTVRRTIEMEEAHG